MEDLPETVEAVEEDKGSEGCRTAPKSERGSIDVNEYLVEESMVELILTSARMIEYDFVQKDKSRGYATYNHRFMQNSRPPCGFPDRPTHIWLSCFTTQHVHEQRKIKELGMWHMPQAPAAGFKRGWRRTPS